MISLNNFDANVDCTDNKGYFERGLRVIQPEPFRADLPLKESDLEAETTRLFLFSGFGLMHKLISKLDLYLKYSGTYTVYLHT